MDEIRLRLLRAELKRQLARIDEVFELLETRAREAGPDSPAGVESTAYQLHNFYSATEDLLELVAAAFENSVADIARWHTQLSWRMTLEIEGVRPALLVEETAQLMQKLRAFRHFFRHAYGAELDYERVQENVDRARQLKRLLWRDVEGFLANLGPLPEAD